MERHLVDTEILRDLRDGDAVLTGPGHTHDVLAKLSGLGAGMTPIPTGRSAGKPDRMSTVSAAVPSRAFAGRAFSTESADSFGIR